MTEAITSAGHSDGLDASYATTRYCNNINFKKPCQKQDCPYLHKIVPPELRVAEVVNCNRPEHKCQGVVHKSQKTRSEDLGEKCSRNTCEILSGPKIDYLSLDPDRSRGF